MLTYKWQVCLIMVHKLHFNVLIFCRVFNFQCMHKSVSCMGLVGVPLKLQLFCYCVGEECVLLIKLIYLNDGPKQKQWASRE